MEKRLRSPFYTESKYVRVRDRGFELNTVYGKDGTLFAKGIYPTSIRKEDLPPFYIQGWIGRKYGWIDTKNFYDLVYKPNKFTNHAFKDDFLMISYTQGQKIEKGDSSLFQEYKGYDVLLWGGIIPDFVAAAKKNSSFDVSVIIRQIQDKLAWLKATYPEDYNSIVGDWIFDP